MKYSNKHFRNLLLNAISRAATAALAMAVVFGLTAVSTPSAQAQAGWTEKVLFSFNGSNGYYPFLGGLIFDSAGNLYGMTEDGGAYGYGTVFELTPTEGGNWTEKLLHSFNNNGSDGTYPLSGLIFDRAGNLYGMTQYGGLYNDGLVFELARVGAEGWTEKALHSFNQNGTDGYWPSANLIFDAAGNLYGTTNAGGAYGYGMVFEMMAVGAEGLTEKALLAFDHTDGQDPIGGLTFDRAGNLYGTTVNGGYTGSDCADFGSDGCGTVFELTPQAGGGWGNQMLIAFDYADGAFPWDGVVLDGAGNVYGTTAFGGDDVDCYAGCGTVFELTPTSGGGWTYTMLLEFNYSNGMHPYGSLILDSAGNLYGTTLFGGDSDDGIVFELTPTLGGWTQQILHSFSGEDGAVPAGNLIFDAAGNLYGTTSKGGSNYSGPCSGVGCGTVFELSPN